jgi:cobalt-zinc-cadmium efflux system outer membrane protein
MSLGSKYENIVKIIYINMLVLLMAGCAAQSPNEDASGDFAYISAGLEERTNYSPRRTREPGKFELPEWVTLDDGLSQDEAVALALWNNARFQADLAALGFARADLLEANMLSNPVFSILFPVNPELLEATLDIPIDVLWQRPHRVAVAKLDAQKLSENLIQDGLGLVREVQTNYGDILSAQERLILSTEEAQLKKQISQLDQARLRAGEISELTMTASYMDMLQATDAIKRFSQEVDILEQKLNNLLGIDSDDIKFDIVPAETSPIPAKSVDDILKTAFVCRPDLRAAELAIEAAGERVGWQKSKVYNFIAVLGGDDTELKHETFVIRPGFSVEVPLFNQNDAKIAHAKAELEQAAKQYEVVRQNIILEVKQAYTQYVSAYEQFYLWNNDIVPSLEQVLEQTTKSFEIGEVPYLTVLEANQKLIEAKIQLTELTANVHRIAAELNYCVGKKMI